MSKTQTKGRSVHD